MDLRGRAVRGKRGERFFYLMWGDVGADNSFTMFRRANLMVGDIDPNLLAAAARDDGLLVATVSLTVDCGCPRCGRVRPPVISWRTDRLTQRSAEDDMADHHGAAGLLIRPNGALRRRYFKFGRRPRPQKPSWSESDLNNGCGADATNQPRSRWFHAPPAPSTSPSGNEPEGRSYDAKTDDGSTRAPPTAGSSPSADTPGSTTFTHTCCAPFIMATLDAGVPLREVQLAARHADPRTTTVYDHRRQDFDRHAAYAVVAFVTSG
jgi:hypothetical protein